MPTIFSLSISIAFGVLIRTLFESLNFMSQYWRLLCTDDKKNVLYGNYMQETCSLLMQLHNDELLSVLFVSL